MILIDNNQIFFGTSQTQMTAKVLSLDESLTQSLSHSGWLPYLLDHWCTCQSLSLHPKEVFLRITATIHCLINDPLTFHNVSQDIFKWYYLNINFRLVWESNPMPLTFWVSALTVRSPRHLSVTVHPSIGNFLWTTAAIYCLIEDPPTFQNVSLDDFNWS